MGGTVGHASERILEFESGLTLCVDIRVDFCVDFAGELRAEFELDQTHLAPTYVTLLDRELSRI